MALQLQGLALHLQEAWLHRLHTPARIRRGGGGGGDTLPHDLSPLPTRRGPCTAPLRSPAAAGARPGGRPRAPAARSWAEESAGAAARGTRDTGRRDKRPPPPPPPAATGPRPAGAGTGGPPGGGKRALYMAGARQTGVHSAAGAREALTARPRPEPRRLARQAPSPDCDVVPCPDVRAERARCARRQ